MASSSLIVENYDGAQKCDFVRFTFCDIHGIARGRSVPARNLEHTLENGVDVYAGLVAVGPRCSLPVIPSVVKVQNGNSKLKPQPGTFHYLPWISKDTKRTVGEVLCEPFWLEGDRPQEASPRYQARKQLDRLREMGYELLSAVEPEFTVIHKDTKEPIFAKEEYMANLYLAQVEPFLYDVDELLEGAGIEADIYSCEYGSGQLEIPLKAKKGIASPDQIFLFHEAMKEICQQRGLEATFMTKPYADSMSSAYHFNHSLWTVDGKSVFYDSTKTDNLSDVCRYWLGGLIKHTRALCALSSPTVNCYRRLHMPFAPDRVNWGIESRLCTYRVKNQGPKGTYIESRLPGAAANPYLLAAGNIAAGIDGILNHIEPTPAKDMSATLLPDSLAEAIAEFEQDQVLCDAFGKEFLEFFLTEKKTVEIAHFDQWNREDNNQDLFEKERNLYALML